MGMIILWIGLLLAGAAGGWVTKGQLDEGEIANTKLAVEKEKNDALKDAATQKARADEIAGEFLASLQKLRITNTTINREIHRETEKLVYGDPNCILPATGVMLLNKSIREANGAAGSAEAIVPSITPVARGSPGADEGTIRAR